MKNKILKIMSILVVIIMMVMCLSNIVMADDLLDPTSVTAQSTTASTSVGNIISEVLGIVQVIAIGVAVIMLVVLAIKYISASPSEKANIKEGLKIYIVGAVLLFGASGILQILKSFAGQIQIK